MYMRVISMPTTYMIHTYRFSRLHDHLESTGKNVSQLPNWAFSVAVAHFYLGCDEEEEKKKEVREDHSAKSDELLQAALLSFPSVLLSLLDKCSVDASDEVSKHKFFLEAHIGYNYNSKRTKLFLLYFYKIVKIVFLAGNTPA